MGAHLWFVERMTSVSRKKQVAKLAAEIKLTEAQARYFRFFLLVIFVSANFRWRTGSSKTSLLKMGRRRKERFNEKNLGMKKCQEPTKFRKRSKRFPKM